MDMMDILFAQQNGEGGSSGFSEEFRLALYDLVSHIGAWTDKNGQTYIDNLYNAMNPTAKVDYITAVYTQSSTVYSTDTLDSLRSDLVVIAHYTDSTTSIVSLYTLTGTLEVGTSTITISYGGKTTTFNVIVTEKVVSSISAVFTQGSAIVYNDASLNSLRQYLTVIAIYDDTTTAVITDYSLSGTLVVGTSTITATYRNHTDIFNVTVTERQIEYLYNWDFTQSLTDSVQGRAAVLKGSDSSSYPVQDENGLHFTKPTAAIYLSNGGMIDFKGRTFEFDVAYANFTGNTSNHIRYLMASTGATYGNGPLIWRADVGWSIYGYTKSTGYNKAWGGVWGNLSGSSSEVLNCMSGKTVKIVCSTDGLTTSLYIDNELIGTQNKVIWRGHGFDGEIYFGGFGSSAINGDQVQELTLTGLRIYDTIE